MPNETSPAPALPDGHYDVVVIDTVDHHNSHCTLSLVISAGPAKGEVFDIGVGGIDIDPLQLLGLPGTVEVAGGEPHFALT